MEPRTRDLSEIFERALAAYAQNFPSLLGLVVAATIPLALLQYPINEIAQPQLDAMLRILEHPEIARAGPIPPALTSPSFLAATILLTLAGYLAWAFSLSAVAVAVERLYTGGRIGFSACWHPVVRQALSIVAVLGLALLALICVDLAVVGVVVGVVAFVVALAPPLVPAVAPAAIVFALAVTTVAPALLIMPCVFAFYAAAVESDGPLVAARVSLGRIFTRAELGRSIVCVTVVSLIVFGASLLVEILAVFGLSRWAFARIGVDAAVRSLVLPFVGIVLALYYFDVRIRREGFDIENGLARIPAAGEPVYAPTAYLSGEERILIVRFLERRDELTGHYRAALAAKLATPVRPRLPADLQRLDDESLLERL